LGGLNPPRVIIHGNMVDKLPQAYHKYLVNVFRKAFKWVGTPVSVEFKASENPFEGRKNKQTSRLSKRGEKAEMKAKLKKKRKPQQRRRSQ
jgi:GTP-binding protein